MSKAIHGPVAATVLLALAWCAPAGAQTASPPVAPSPASPASPAAAPTSAIRLAPMLAKDASFTYEIERSLRLEQRPPDDPRPLVTSTRFRAVVRLDVGTVRADGTTEVGVQFQSLSLTRDRAGEEITFHHPPTEPAAKDGTGEPDKAATPYDIVGGAWTRNRPRLVINREGSVQSMLGADPIIEALRAAEAAGSDFDAAEIASLSPAAIGDLLTPVFNPAEPERATRTFAPGEAWSVSRRVDLASLGAIVTTESWKRGPDDGRGAVFEAAISAEAVPPRGIVTAAPAMTLEVGTGSALIRWDAGAVGEAGEPGGGAALARFEHKLLLGFKLALGDLKLEQTQVAETTITRRP